jgi:hypothetical protein
MRNYYRTSSANAEKIVSGGFVDAEGIAESGDVFRGVWITDRPVEGADGMSFGDPLVAMDVDDPRHCARIDVFEWDASVRPDTSLLWKKERRRTSWLLALPGIARRTQVLLPHRYPALPPRR